ncbi:MAG: SprT-like domain-containing protein [Deltaproteobacteria bacterium]|nr:SprT-like domain-containing protein [Deltaproteobacteria bacterium]
MSANATGPVAPTPTTATEPTSEQFAAYRAMFDHFNREVFEGNLPPVILNFSRHAGALGFFAPERWQRIAADGTTIHEISLNPSYLGTRPARETASTLVHEMCHLWQQVHGEPPRRGYHDREWSRKMVTVGLQPICPKTGQDKMSAPALTHRIIEGGPFAKAFESLPTEALLPWTCAERRLRTSPAGGSGAEGDGPEGEEPKKTRNKLKFTCPACGANAWGKPGLLLLCVDDHEPMPLVAVE